MAVQEGERINERGYLEMESTEPEVVIDVASIDLTLPRRYKGTDAEVSLF